MISKLIPFFLLSNRSHAYMKMNKLSEAVRDAKYTVAMRPDWGKGYFRLGRALSGQDNPDEALVAFFHCLVLEETCSKALRTEIVKVRQKQTSLKCCNAHFCHCRNFTRSCRKKRAGWSWMAKMLQIRVVPLR